MGDVISSHLDEAKREIITGEKPLIAACCALFRLFSILTDNNPTNTSKTSPAKKDQLEPVMLQENSPDHSR